MTNHAHGTFDAKVTPQPSNGNSEDATPDRTSLEKQFHGDLEGTSKGEMLTGALPLKDRRATSP